MGNLIDLAVQGRHHGSLDAAFALLLVTSVVYTAAQRPRLVADSGGLTIVNPLRDHRVGWAAVAASTRRTDPGALRVAAGRRRDGQPGHLLLGRAFLPPQAGRRADARPAAGRPGPPRGGGVSVRSARRRRRGLRRPTAADADHVITALTALADQANAAAPDERAAPPVSTWNWMAVALIVVPALALLIAVLA